MSSNKIYRGVATALLSALLVLLAACGSEQDPNISISGELVRTGEKALPAKASARVSMFELRDGGGDKRIVAERSIHQVDGQSIKFDLEIARNLLNPNEEYGLRAEIMSPDGDVLSQVKQPLRFKPLEQGEPIRLEMAEVRNEMEMAFTKYRCEDGFHLAAAIGNDQAVVRLGNRRLVLPAGDTQDTFTDEHNNELKINDDAGIAFRVDDSAHTQCREVTDQTPPQQSGGNGTPGSGAAESGSSDQNGGTAAQQEADGTSTDKRDTSSEAPVNGGDTQQEDNAASTDAGSAE